MQVTVGLWKRNAKRRVSRSSILIAAPFAVVSSLSAPVAGAQLYPVKPVRVIVPFAPGGGSDIAARQFSAKLSEAFGQQFVVDNRGGAGGLIGMELAAKAPPDGYTLIMMGGGFAATAAVQKPAWDPINAIVPIAEFGITRRLTSRSEPDANSFGASLRCRD